jgi:hypothetical protein
MTVLPVNTVNSVTDVNWWSVTPGLKNTGPPRQQGA